MNEAHLAALTAFVAKIAKMRHTGSGWIVTENNRVVLFNDLAIEAKELLALQPYTVTEATMVKALIPGNCDAQEILAAIAERKRTHET